MAPLFLAALLLATQPAPADWSGVPLVHLNRDSGIGYADTVPVMQLAERRRECRAGIGPMPGPSEAPNVRMLGLRLELILLVAPDGRLLNILAAPGPCDAIRNYARALINRNYRGKVRAPEGSSAAWYRTSLGFRWQP
jgi:hypothetical protein